jgi:hypothetical protein
MKAVNLLCKCEETGRMHSCWQLEEQPAKEIKMDRNLVLIIPNVLF